MNVARWLSSHMAQSARSQQVEQLIIVVGAHPNAERTDRATAYQLRERVGGAMARRASDSESERAEVLVCCDVWYLNDESLRGFPAICLGAPGINAFSAYLASRLPSAFVIDDVLMIQMDSSPGRALACCWGTSPGGTARAADIFCERYFDEFITAAFAK